MAKQRKNAIHAFDDIASVCISLRTYPNFRYRKAQVRESLEFSCILNGMTVMNKELVQRTPCLQHIYLVETFPLCYEDEERGEPDF